VLCNHPTIRKTPWRLFIVAQEGKRDGSKRQSQGFDEAGQKVESIVEPNSVNEELDYAMTVRTRVMRLLFWIAQDAVHV
jgi:hypothetical protein